MKITEVKPFSFTENGRGYFFVKVETDEGIYGVGEGGISSHSLAMAEYVNHLKAVLIGEDPSRIEHLWQVMFRSAFFPPGRIGCAAVSAIDIALWDIRGKALGVPVYDLLGGRVRDKVVCYPHISSHSMDSVEELANEARKAKAQGWKFVRWGVPQENGGLFDASRCVRQTIKQCAGVRDAVGEEIEILIDFHTRLDPPHAIQLSRALEEFHPYFIEDPIRSENPASFHQLVRHIALPLAAGEQFASKWEFRELVEEELIQYARIDLCIVGGITEAKKIAGWCETHYIDIAPHNPLGPVSAAACLHLDLATSNFSVQELPRPTGTSLNDVFPVQVEWKAGYLYPPARPGLGIEFDEEAAASKGYQESEPRGLTRPDGSYTNW